MLYDLFLLWCLYGCVVLLYAIHASDSEVKEISDSLVFYVAITGGPVVWLTVAIVSIMTGLEMNKRYPRR